MTYYRGIYHWYGTAMSTAKPWLSRKEAAAFLTAAGYPIAAGTLARLVGKKTSPPYRRFGWRTVAYNRDDLMRWAEASAMTIEGGVKPW